MVQKQTFRGEHAHDNGEILAQVFQTDMLKHAHAGNFVEACLQLGDGAIVPQLDAALVLQLGAADSFRSHGCLFLAQGDAVGVRTEPGGRMQQQTAPTAADVEEALVWGERELTADQFQLICLGILQLFSGIAKIGAGVSQGGSKPGAIKVDGEVIVVGDGGAVPIQRVLSPAPEPLGQVKEERQRLRRM